MSADTISFLYKWQTLIGAALGPFLAILLSALGYWIGSIFLSLKAKKEAVRMVEVSTTRTLNDMYFTRKKLEDFVRRVRGLATEAREIDDDNTYFLSTTNFPAVRDIFFNTDLPNLKFGSPYLHNQLMFADAGIKETNSWLKELKENFGTLVENNKFTLTLAHPQTPRAHREDCAANLDTFAQAVEDFLVYIRTGIKMATQIKTYNMKLMKGRIRNIWWHEKATLKLFKSKQALDDYCDWDNLINRVNKDIEKEVDKSLADTERKFRERG